MFMYFFLTNGRFGICQSRGCLRYRFELLRKIYEDRAYFCKIRIPKSYVIAFCWINVAQCERFLVRKDPDPKIEGFRVL